MQETRGFNPIEGSTFALRRKADTPDYRYMPDPELAPLIVPKASPVLAWFNRYRRGLIKFY